MYVFQLIASSRRDGLQKTCHVAHACCVVSCDWIPTSGPKNKQHSKGKVGKTKHEHYSVTMATVRKYFEVVNLIQSLRLQR